MLLAVFYIHLKRRATKHSEKFKGTTFWARFPQEVCPGFCLFGWATLTDMREIVTWDVDQQFGGRRDDDPNERKTAISPEEIWDLYWHPVRSWPHTIQFLR